MERNPAESSSNRSTLLHLMEIARLVDELKKKLEKNEKTSLDCKDLHFFKELCTNGDPKMCGIVGEAVINFVKSGVFSLSMAFPWFISMLQSSSKRNRDGIIQIIADLLLLNNDISFGLSSPQHPFILALKQDEQSWTAIAFHLSYMFKCRNNTDFKRRFITITPLFKYILWSPTGTVSSTCKRGVWKFFIDNFRSEYLDFLVDTICWLPSHRSNSILDVDHFFGDYSEFQQIMNKNDLHDAMCVYYAYVSCKLAEHGHNPTSFLEITKALLQKYPSTTDIVLVLIAETLINCPPQFLNVLLLTCIELIEFDKNSSIAVHWLLIGAVLPWVIHSLPMIESVYKTTEKLLTLVEENKEFRPTRNLSHLLADQYFMRVITSEREMHWAFIIARSLETVNHKHLMERITDLQIAQEESLNNPFLLLCINAVLLSCDDANTQMKALDVSLMINPGSQLPIILYMLARSPNPPLQLKLLHSLPLTAAAKENVSAVLRSVDALFSSGKAILKNLSIEIYLILWKIEERCYACLHDCLLEFEESHAEDIWERDVVLASAIRRICLVKPEKYGKEWISILNEIIKRWHQNKNGNVPSVLALDAILILCKANVLKVVSIYKLLSERLFDDKRLDVTKKFCALTEFMFTVINKEDFDDLKEILLHAVSKMWSIISSSTEKDAILSAMSALSKFNKNNMRFTTVPEVYRKNVKLPKPKRNIPTNEPEDFVPGNVWIIFLQHTPQHIRANACEMLICWLQEEVDNFPRSLYASIRGEPKDFNFLFDRTLCKALVNYLKTFAKENNTDEINLETSIMCLKILNGNLTKTLPLLNWSFLWQLLEIKQFRLTEQIVTLFAKQSRTSSSARICIENYLNQFAVSDQEDELRIVFNVMTDLCYGISTIVLKNFLNNVVHYVINKMINGDKSLLTIIYDSFGKALKNPDIEDNNRICISECIGLFWENTSHDDELFINLIDVVTELPITYIEHLCSPITTSDLSSCDTVRKLLKLRCAMALKVNDDNPFTWLQECVEVTTLYLEEKNMYYRYSLEVITKYRVHSSRWSWLLKYMSYIHSVSSELSEVQLNFICDVFIFNVVNLSTYKPFISSNLNIEEYFQLFPQALNEIIVMGAFGQVIEWLCRMNKSTKINHNYRLLFYNGMVSLKNNKYLSDINNWTKMLS